MNPTFKAKWVAALRSGEYKQGKYVLRDQENNFCCLGVLMDIDGCLWNPTELCRVKTNIYSVDGSGETTKLTAITAVKFDLSDEKQVSLISMNDSGKTFAEIADYIEKDL